MLSKQLVLTSGISTGSFDDFVESILQLGAARTSAYVCCANVHMVVEAYRDASFQQVLDEASLVTPDGGPVASVAGWVGGHPQERVAGMDLLPALLAEAARRGRSVYFYGTTDDVLQAIVDRAQRELPALGWWVPAPRRFEPSPRPRRPNMWRPSTLPTRICCSWPWAAPGRSGGWPRTGAK